MRPYLVFSKMFSMLEFAQDIVDGQPLGKKFKQVKLRETEFNLRCQNIMRN